MAADVVCLGILVADVIARPVDELPPRGSLGLVDEVSLHGGGCALNTATVLTRLGRRAAVAGKVGADPFGDFLLALCDERDVDRTRVRRDPVAATSATVVLVDATGERTFLHLPGANGELRAEELDRDRLLDTRRLHVAGALVMPALDGEPEAALLAEARRRGVATSLDTVYDASGRWERVVPCLPHVDVFTPGLAEAEAIASQRGPERAAARLRELGAAAVCVTLGPDGCWVDADELTGHVPAPRVHAVDGTGAGDAFAAGLLHGLLDGLPLGRAVRLGNAAGALATTAVGATEAITGAEAVAACEHAPPDR